jgi:hypothetical protein
MAEGFALQQLDLRQLDLGRLAALRIRLTTALIFRSEGLPGRNVVDREIHDQAVQEQQGVIAKLDAAATWAMSRRGPSLGTVLSEVLCPLEVSLNGTAGASTILAKRVASFHQAITAFDCPHCASAGDERKCIAEFLELFGLVHEIVAEAYRKVADDGALVWPKVLLEMAPHHAHQTTDILDIAAATGTCRIADDDGPISIVGLGIKDDAFCWTTVCQLPYVLMHELLVHAFQGLKGSGRSPVDPTCAWSEGWMDGLAFRLMEQWLDANSSQLPKWVRESRKTVSAQGSRLHERRREPQDSIQPAVLRERVAAYETASALEAYYQGKSKRNTHASLRLFRFSLRLNLHAMPQKDRNQIADWLALALELFHGSRLDDVIGTCERFVQHDNWQKLSKELETLVFL